MDEDFLHERKIDYGADSQGLPEWHDANRFYNAERPQLPQVEIKIPITQLRNPRILPPPSSLIHKNRQNKSASNDIIDSCVRTDKSQKHRVANLPVTHDARSGWTLAKGWKNRPRHRVVDTAVVDDRIMTFAERIKSGKDKQHGLLHSGDERLNNLSRDQMENPGPRYNTTDTTPLGYTSQAVDFGSTKRFMTEAPRSPGPYINTRDSPTVLGISPTSCIGTPIFRPPTALKPSSKLLLSQNNSNYS